MQIAARRMGRARVSRSSADCMLGTRSPAENSWRGSTPSVERARVLSCTALRSISNNTMTMAMPSSICGAGPNKRLALPNASTQGLRSCPTAISAPHSARETASTWNASDPRLCPLM